MLQALHAEHVVDGIRCQLDQQTEHVAAIREDLRAILQASLVTFARITHDQARQWVERTLG